VGPADDGVGVALRAGAGELADVGDADALGVAGG